jgi:hypothetical protein
MTAVMDDSELAHQNGMMSMSSIDDGKERKGFFM